MLPLPSKSAPLLEEEATENREDVTIFRWAAHSFPGIVRSQQHASEARCQPGIPPYPTWLRP